MPSHRWARGFTVDNRDIDYLTNLLLERETPLSSDELAYALIEARLKEEADEINERYKDARIFNPSHSYKSGQRLVFPAMDYVTGVVTKTRPGDNPDYGTFTVISVQFEDNPTLPRQFASELIKPHQLSQEDTNGLMPMTASGGLSAAEIYQASRDEINLVVDNGLKSAGSLVRLVDKWFPRDLILEVNMGHLNLAEAVLDMNGGGPLATLDILEQMGGLGSSPLELQVFSLNYALNQDSRFDEVGPAGEVLWYLTRLEPQDVVQTPQLLRYSPVIEYDATQLSDDMLALELEIGDEHSRLETDERITQADIYLTYPHRRVGTLPLNHRMRHIFPTARRTPRIWVTLVDGQDDEEYVGWVVHQEGYVFGLAEFYRKHRLPVGTHLTVQKGDRPDTVVVDFTAYKPRTEWLRLMAPKNGQVHFENHKRSIGAEYDELMILGVDDLQTVDAVYQAFQQQKKSLAALLRILIPELGRLSPQGTVHAKTLYSAVNVFRRCPPGPMFATLVANPEFQNVGGHYWKLVE